jgi:hypothetical protein
MWNLNIEVDPLARVLGQPSALSSPESEIDDFMTIPRSRPG